MFEIYKDLATLLGENNQNEIIRKLNLFCNAIYGFFVIYESLRKIIKCGIGVGLQLRNYYKKEVYLLDIGIICNQS